MSKTKYKKYFTGYFDIETWEIVEMIKENYHITSAKKAIEKALLEFEENHKKDLIL